MAGSSLSYWDYLKAAFRHPLTLPLMGRMPVNLMALAMFGLLGFANPGFWLLGAAGEVAYLTWLSSNKRFQKLVEGGELLKSRQSWEERLAATVSRLSPQNRARYHALLEKCRYILGLGRSFGTDDIADLAELRGSSLNQILSIFLRLLLSRQVTIDNLRHVAPGEIEQEVGRLEERLATLDRERDAPLVRSLEATLAIQRKRLDNLERGRSSLQVIDAELGRIERQVELIREEAAVSGRATALSERLDQVTSTMSETSRWMDENEEIFGTLDESGGEPPAELPRLPEA